VLPAAILTDRFWPPGHKVPKLSETVYINVGAPLRLEGSHEDPAAVKAGTERIKAAIQALHDEARAARDAKAKWPRAKLRPGA